MPRWSANLLALFSLFALVAASESSDTVTCSLQDYQDLFRKAHRQQLEESFERERRDMKADVKLLENELAEKQKALRDQGASRSQREAIIPGNSQLVSHHASGSVNVSSAPDESSMGIFNMSLDLRVFEDQWTAIALIDAQTIVSDFSILRSDVEALDWQPVSLGADTLLVIREREQAKDDEPWDDHSLVTNKSGLYRISFRIFVPVMSDRHLNGLTLNLVHPLTEATLSIEREGQVHLREFNVEPFARLETTESERRTHLRMRLRSTKQLSLKWRVHQGIKAPSRSNKHKQIGDMTEDGLDEAVGQATVVHDALHSVDDGILESFHSFKYTRDSEQSLKAEIFFAGSVRVTSVVAHGMKTWRALATNGSVSETDSLIPGSLVQVDFKSSVISKEIIVMVTTELEFNAQTHFVGIPAAACQGVLRQAGSLAVVKVANVEIYEQSSAGVQRTGTDSLPSHMKGRTTQPIVLAYKFPSPRFSIGLSVINHEELTTLEAVADAVLTKILVVETQTMNTMLLTLQNTRRQYMEVRGIPADATFWSLKVNSVGTKPVRGHRSQGSLLVPLLVGSGTAGATKTSVELAWSTSIASLGDNGSLTLPLPHLDVPISALSVEVQFPESYDVNFTGSLRKVDRFSQNQPTKANYETGDHVVEHGFDFSSAPPPRKGKGSSGVQAKMPRAGLRHRFEELLVVNGSSALTVNYSIVRPRENTTNFLEGILSFLR